MDLIIGLVVGILSYCVGYLFGRFCESQDNPEPVEKVGHWIPVDPKSAACSCCNNIFFTSGSDQTMSAQIHKSIYRYCPHCGARMGDWNE